jgi:hypothetical protein
MKAKIKEGFGGASHTGKRVPIGEPGLVFYRSHKSCMPPLQKGDKLQNPREHSVEIEEEELPRWMDGGDYVVHAVTVTEDMKEPRDDHVVVAIRQGRPHAWLVQQDILFVGEEAQRLMGPDFDWNLISPEGPAMVASRIMSVASSGMFPEIDWVLVSRVKGNEKVYASSPAYQALVKDALDRVAKEN